MLCTPMALMLRKGFLTFVNYLASLIVSDFFRIMIIVSVDGALQVNIFITVA